MGGGLLKTLVIAAPIGNHTHNGDVTATAAISATSPAVTELLAVPGILLLRSVDLHLLVTTLWLS